MPLLRTSVVVGAVTFLEAGCLLGVACLGRAAVPLASLEPRASAEPVAVAPAAAAPAPAAKPEHPSTIPTGERAPVVTAMRVSSDERDQTSPARAPRPSRTESEFLRDLLSRDAGDARALEFSVRTALAGDGPDCEKIAALRAAVETRSPAADDLLAAAVESLVDRSSPSGESVPRVALRFLAERAPREAVARAHLWRFAFASGSRLERSLRASAAAAYALAADEGEIPGMAALLSNESDPLVRDGALEALGRNPHTAAAQDVLARLGVERSVPDERE